MQSAFLRKALGMLRSAFGEQEEYVTAELVLATLLESARLGNSGPATVAANARRRVDTPGGGGQIPGGHALASRSGNGVVQVHLLPSLHAECCS